MTSLFDAIILDNTILFIGTVLFFLMWVAFPETVARGDFKRLKKFFY